MKKIILPLFVLAFVGHVYAQAPTVASNPKYPLQHAHPKHQSELELAAEIKKS